MIRTRYLLEEPPLQLDPLTEGSIMDLSLMVKENDPTGHWLIMRPNIYVTMDLTTLSVDQSYLEATGLDRFVYFPDYRVAGRIGEIVRRFREAQVSLIMVGTVHQYTKGHWGDSHQSLQLTEEALVRNSLDPLNPKHQPYFFGLIKNERMGRVGLIPYTYIKDKLHFLLGKNFEERNWKSSGKWTDFGGSVELGESVEEAASREGFEESMGLLGTYEELLEKVQGIPQFSYAKNIAIPLKVSYCEGNHWPKTFSQVYGYLHACFKCNFLGVPSLPVGPEGYFEKTQLNWFDLDYINKNKDLFLPVLRQTLNKMVKKKFFPR